MTPTLYWIDDGQRRDRLAILPRPRGGDWLADEIRSWKSAGIDVVVSALTKEENRELGLDEEAKLCQVDGIEFVSFPLPDRGVPEKSDSLTTLFRRLEAALANGKRIGFHCRQGIGRSSLLAASLLVATGTDSDRAFERIARARGCQVPDTPEQRQWVKRFAEDLVAVIKRS